MYLKRIYVQLFLYIVMEYKLDHLVDEHCSNIYSHCHFLDLSVSL